MDTKFVFLTFVLITSFIKSIIYQIFSKKCNNTKIKLPWPLVANKNIINYTMTCKLFFTLHHTHLLQVISILPRKILNFTLYCEHDVFNSFYFFRLSPSWFSNDFQMCCMSYMHYQNAHKYKYKFKKNKTLFKFIHEKNLKIYFIFMSLLFSWWLFKKISYIATVYLKKKKKQS